METETTIVELTGSIPGGLWYSNLQGTSPIPSGQGKHVWPMWECNFEEGRIWTFPKVESIKQHFVWKRSSPTDIDRLFRAKQNPRLLQPDCRLRRSFFAPVVAEPLEKGQCNHFRCKSRPNFATRRFISEIEFWCGINWSWNEWNLSELQTNLLIAPPVKESNNQGRYYSARIL